MRRPLEATRSSQFLCVVSRNFLWACCGLQLPAYLPACLHACLHACLAHTCACALKPRSNTCPLVVDVRAFCVVLFAAHRQVKQHGKDGPAGVVTTRRGKLIFVDLAGSERIRRTTSTCVGGVLSHPVSSFCVRAGALCLGFADSRFLVLVDINVLPRPSLALLLCSSPLSVVLDCQRPSQSTHPCPHLAM